MARTIKKSCRDFEGRQKYFATNKMDVQVFEFVWICCWKTNIHADAAADGDDSKDADDDDCCDNGIA